MHNRLISYVSHLESNPKTGNPLLHTDKNVDEVTSQLEQNRNISMLRAVAIFSFGKTTKHNDIQKCWLKLYRFFVSYEHWSARCSGSRERCRPAQHSAADEVLELILIFIQFLICHISKWIYENCSKNFHVYIGFIFTDVPFTTTWAALQLRFTTMNFPS